MRAIRPPLVVFGVLVLAVTGTVHADWSETFDNGAFDLTTWLFRSYPEVTGTFKGQIETGPDVIDLIGQTSLREAMQIAGSATECLTYLGLMAFVALSQRVETTIYVRSRHEVTAVRNYVPDEWRAYCREVVRLP